MAKPSQIKFLRMSCILRSSFYACPVFSRHVVELAESIAVLGLLEPIVLDTAGHLLAGGHRLAALQLLAEPPAPRRATFLVRCGWKPADDNDAPNPELAALADRLAMLGDAPLPKTKVAVQVVDVTGRDGSDRALAVEAAENNVRRQYTNDEIAALADRFKAAGYKVDSGRPKKGEKTMLGALEAAVGRSKRQIQRVLDGGPPTKSAWERAVTALERAAARVVAEGKGRDSDRARSAVAVAKKALEALRD